MSISCISFRGIGQDYFVAAFIFSFVHMLIFLVDNIRPHVGEEN